MSSSPRLGVAAGFVGPSVFTVAWIAASWRQGADSLVTVQLSGLAAPDARDWWIMMVGFVVLGGCTVAFGRALRRALGTRADPGIGPRLIQICGWITIAVGLLRRDRMALTPGGLTANESWHNHAHDVASLVLFAALIGGLLALGRRFRGDPDWSDLRHRVMGAGWITLGLLILVYSVATTSWVGAVQRAAVTVPLAATMLLAWRLANVTGSDPTGRAPRSDR
jgi:hypothetical protein